MNQNLFEISIISVAFNVISILTGTGYVTKDFDQWGSFPLIFFLKPGCLKKKSLIYLILVVNIVGISLFFSSKIGVSHKQFFTVEEMKKDNQIRTYDSIWFKNFSAIQKRILLKEPRKIDFLSNKNPAIFMAFDCLIKNGIDIRKNPLLQRKQQIENCIKTLEYKPDELLQMIQKNEMEGIVLKDPNGISNTNWVKFKNWVEATYKVIGTNSLSQNISSLELENDKGIAVGSVNYQFNEPELQTDQIKEKLIGSLVEVRSMFTSKGKVRFPSLQKKDKLIKFLKSGRNLEDFSRKSVQEILS